MTISPGTLAGASARHPWRTIAVWVLALAGAFVLAITLVPDALDGDDGPIQTLESERAEQLINERFGPLDRQRGGGETSSGPETQGFFTLTEFVLISATDSRPGDPATRRSRRGSPSSAPPSTGRPASWWSARSASTSARCPTTAPLY
jgi:hypothetical protein